MSAESFDDNRGNGLKAVSLAIVLFVAAGAYTKSGETEMGFVLLDLYIRRPWVIFGAGVLGWLWLWFRYTQHRSYSDWRETWGRIVNHHMGQKENSGGSRELLEDFVVTRFGQPRKMSTRYEADRGVVRIWLWYESDTEWQQQLVPLSGIPRVRKRVLRDVFFDEPIGWDYWTPHLAAMSAALALAYRGIVELSPLARNLLS